MRLVVTVALALLALSIFFAGLGRSDPGLEHRVYRLESQVKSLEHHVNRLESEMGRTSRSAPAYDIPRARDPQRWARLECGMSSAPVRDLLGLANAGVERDGNMIWVYGGKTPAGNSHVVFDAQSMRVVSWTGP